MNLQQLLINEYSRRRLNNKAYSIRAFARDLGIGKSSVSDVLNGKSQLSDKSCERVALSLGYSFEDLVKLKSETASEHNEVSECTFSKISDWYYFAILSLARIPDESADVTSLSERLDISKLEVRSALEKLEELGLIVVEENKLIRTSQPIISSTDKPLVALKEHHSQNLDRAKTSLHETSVALREISSITTPIDLKKIEEAKKEIRKFQIKMSKLLNTSESQEVYTLAIQLFPQTKLNYKNEGESREL